MSDVNTESEKACVAYEPNCNHKHSWGEPEILVSYPKAPIGLSELHDYISIALNKNSYELEDLLQTRLCDIVQVDVVEPHSEPGLFSAYSCTGTPTTYEKIDVTLMTYFGEDFIRLRVFDVDHLYE
jgi:hypothetical protein